MKKNNKSYTEDFWPSISDLMSGLIIIFMFISISFMLKVNQEKEKMENIAEQYHNIKIALYEDLKKEFEKDFIRWDAKLDKEHLSITFNNPDIYFKQGSTELSDQFKAILDDFFIRYIRILYSEKYNSEIEEVRIEGHTSSEWSSDTDKIDSYFKNMQLSQGRTRATLEYVMTLPQMKIYADFMIGKVTANGLSFSKKIEVNSIEDKDKSRRVEFKIRTLSEKHIDEILNRKK